MISSFFWKEQIFLILQIIITYFPEMITRAKIIFNQLQKCFSEFVFTAVLYDGLKTKLELKN